MSERTRTHWEDCWKSSDHHECALVKIEAMDKRIRELGAAGQLLNANAEFWKERAEAAEAKLEAVRGLIPGWKEGDFNLPAYALGKRDGRHECAEELEALLK